MPDIRTMNQSTGSREGQEYLDKLRQDVGAGFTDKPAEKKRRNELGKDDFMKLMSAQLKSQDPTSPMKNEQMAAQLAQFSSLEQMVNVNQNLEKMAAAQKPQENVLAASLIGKKVAMDGSKIHLERDQLAEMKFELPADVAGGSIAITNAKGEVVREMPLNAAKTGQQSFKWDGKNNKGLVQDPGEYAFRVTAKDREEKPVQAIVSTSGFVTGVTFEKGKALLLVGDKKISLDSISRIEEATAKDLAQASSQNVGSSANPLAQSPQTAKLAMESALVSAPPSTTTKTKNDATNEKVLSSNNTGGKIREEAVPVSEKFLETGSEVAMNESSELPGTAIWNPNR